METRPFPELSSILGSSSSSKVLVVSLGLGCIKEFVMWEVNKMLGSGWDPAALPGDMGQSCCSQAELRSGWWLQVPGQWLGLTQT